MDVDGEKMRPIWLSEDGKTVKIIDQRKLPHELVFVSLSSVDDVIFAVSHMLVRGAPLIGVTAAYGVYLATRNAPKINIHAFLDSECKRLTAARPTAVNLAWAVDRMQKALSGLSEVTSIQQRAREAAARILQFEVENCRKIGENGFDIIRSIYEQKAGEPVHILTHCNAGWLACVEYGTATAPIYAAHDAGIPVHVWVDETRPLNQGARLTAWELGKYGVAHTLVTDNAGGHLMQHKQVDLVIVGTDRTTHTGDAANKIGTYLKALAARDNGIPFYVALPSSTFDWEIKDGVKEIPIEERDPDEVRFVQGLDGDKVRSVLISPESSPAANYAFDVTPARLVTGFITENGVCEANENAIRALFS